MMVSMAASLPFQNAKQILDDARTLEPGACTYLAPAAFPPRFASVASRCSCNQSTSWYHRPKKSRSDERHPNRHRFMDRQKLNRVRALLSAEVQHTGG